MTDTTEWKNVGRKPMTYHALTRPIRAHMRRNWCIGNPAPMKSERA